MTAMSAMVTPDPTFPASGHAFNCYWFFLPESGSALSGRHRFIPVHVQIVGCGVNALSDLDPRRPDKTRSVASGMSAVLLLRLSKTLADDLQTLTDLSVFNGERYKDAQHVVIRAAGEKN